MSDSFSNLLAAIAAKVEKELDALLAASSLPGETFRPARLMKAMRYAALGGGKRLRPFLTIETARALGTIGPSPLRAGLAIECVHCYSLVHDDLPAMDNDDLRRGRPTLHRAFDEATAILAGDGLLTFAFDILADPDTHPSAEIRSALCIGLARSAGLGGMVGGQILDMEAETSDGALDEEAIHRIQTMKTGALLQFSVEAGAIVAGARSEAREALRRFGAALGTAFQVADDILDAESTDEVMGKRTGKDAARKKGTFVSTRGLMGAKRLRDSLVQEALNALDAARIGTEGETLRQAARFVAARAN